MLSRKPLLPSRGPATAVAALLLILLSAGRSAAQNWPATEIYLAPLTGAGATLAAGAAKPMAPHPGYDNQPFFTPDGQAVLFTSERAADETEIFRFALASGEVTRLTDTQESEYSPTPLPDGGFSVVRVEPDGTQRLWRFDAAGGAAHLVLPQVKGVGYHAWGGTDRLALFVLGEPPTLQVADLVTGQARIVRSGIGRSLHAIPGRKAWSFVAPRDGKPWVQELAWDSGEVRPIAPALDPEGDHDLAWTPDGTLLMAKGSELDAWDEAAQAWRKVRDFAPDGVKAISRLAVSPGGDRLALVGREDDPIRPAERFNQGVHVFGEAKDAHDRQDWHAWRLALDQLAKLLPAQPWIERDRAAAAARDGRPEEAWRRLERLIAWHGAPDVAGDPDLAALRTGPEWSAYLERRDAALQPLACARVGFRAGVADFIPVGLAHDPKSGDFFLASSRRGEILRVRAGGKSRRFATLPAKFGSAGSLAVDAVRRKLWVLADNMPPAVHYVSEAPPDSALCAFALDSGSPQGCLPSLAGSGHHHFHDLAVAADGTVFVSDTVVPAIYRLPPGAPALALWAGPSEVVSPDGLAVSARGDALYVADYENGLLRVDLATGKAATLRTDQAPLAGFDGLSRYGEHGLIAIENGDTPARILRIDLNEAGDAITGVKLLELGRKDWDRLTVGVVAGDDYYYVANSHGTRFGPNGEFLKGPPLTRPTVMRIAKKDLAPPAGRAVLAGREDDPTRPAERFAQGRRLFEEAQAAHDRQDWQAWRQLLDQAAKFLPPQAGLERRRAGALARDGRPDEAWRRLERLIAWRSASDVEADPDLASLRARPEWSAWRARQVDALRPVAHAARAFQAGDAGFVPEGVAHDSKSGDFFLASVRQGIVLRVAAGGKGSRFADLRAAGYGSAGGLAVDATRRKLWVVASDLPPADNFSPQAAVKTALCAFDLDGGSPGGCIAPPAGSVAAHRFDDLTVARDGTVFVSDAEAPAVYRLKPGSRTLDTLVGGAEAVAPNGLALSPKEEALYVADYVNGLLRIDIATGQAAVLRTEAAPLLGIDGLARFGDHALLAIQNGVEPARILRIDLNAAGQEVAGVTVLELGRPDWDEPTLGTVVRDDFYYVSNSHWPRFGPDGKLKEGPELTPPVVMRIAKADLARR